LILKSIEKLGDKTIRISGEIIRFIQFFFKCFILLFHPKSYTKESKAFLLEQIYLSTIHILPLFLFLGVVLGSILVVVAIIFALNFNLTEQIGELLTSFIINEFAPIFTALFITLRYGINIFTKITKLKEQKINPYTNIYIPKLLNGVLAIPSIVGS
jgi:ABC-type transporter Mla maintaining outer membrane lipid asymmetry permease subunit MlaE